MLLFGRDGWADHAQPHQKLPVNRDILFTRITTDDGISHSAVQRVIQDSKGFIWIGTQQGLNRYDGHNFEIFNYSPDDPNSLSNGWIYDIVEDREERIWIATDGGLDLFQGSTKDFRHFRHDPANDSSLPDNSVRTVYQASDGAIWVGSRAGLSRWNGDDTFKHYVIFDPDSRSEGRGGVRAIVEDSHGHIWIGTQTEGLLRIDPETGEEARVNLRPEATATTSNQYVRALLEDDQGIIWAGTQVDGVALIDRDGNIRHLRHDPQDPDSLSSNRIWSIFNDRQGRIWVGTEGGGLNLWLPEEQAFYRYSHDPGNPNSLSDDVVYEIAQDRGDVLWVGTFNGISKWNSEISTFTHIKRDEREPSTLSNNKVSSFAESPDGDIWIGTIGGGVNRWNIESNSFTALRSDGKGGGPAGNLVMSVMHDKQDRLWVGTMRSGVSVMDPESREFEHFAYDRDDYNSLSSNSVSTILQDSRGRIWLATYGGGLNLYMGNGRFERFPGESVAELDFSSPFLVDMEESVDGRLWLASDGGGVIRFDPESGSAESMQFVPNGANSISGNHVICLLETEAGLWVGTRDTGLNLYSDKVWKHFDYRDGLPSVAIYGLLEDSQGHIWISHGKGLSSFDPKTMEFTNYNTIHGLQGNDFNNGAFLKTADGKLLFGGANGFNAFYPDQIHVNTHKPPIRLTRFTKFNKDFPLESPPYELDRIELAHDDYVVGFEFAALDFTDPIKNQYRYMLAGFDPEWVNAKGLRQATYTNLGPGTYTFQVEGSNNDGVWSNQLLSIELEVSPAPWATWWAMAFYIVAAIIVVYGAAQAYSVRLHREEQQRYSEQLEALVAERTRALESEITDHKNAQDELSRSLQEKEVLLKEVHHRVKNNMQVISSLLNIQADSVMDNRFMTLLTESQQRIKSMALIHENLYRSDNLLEINFHDYIEALANGLLRFYRFDNLAISLKLDVDNIFLDIDTAVPCGLIINELVSNSLKHAFENRVGEGLIEVRFEMTEGRECYRFSVSDNGNGIPEEFDLENAPSMGLEIVRILTEQLDGTWRCIRSPGTTFTIDFPRKKR